MLSKKSIMRILIIFFAFIILFANCNQRNIKEYNPNNDVELFLRDSIFLKENNIQTH